MIPPRTPFPDLMPIGLRTAEVEKLTSYLTRLAIQSHITVGALIENYIGSAHGTPTLRSSAVPQAARRLVNAHGATAQAWANRANRLVGRSDLSLLTLLPWSTAFSERSPLTSAARRWCPVCLAQDWQAGTPIYERLIWSLRDVDVCPRHHCCLEDQCPTCRRKHLPEFNHRHVCGFCSSCGAWLGSMRPTCPLPSDKAVRHFQVWTAECCADLLAHPPSGSLAEHRERIVRVIDLCIEQLFSGDRIASSQHLGVLRADTTAWLRGRRYPNPATLFTLAYCLQISVRELLAGTLERCGKASLRRRPCAAPPPPRLPTPSAATWQAVAHCLREVACGVRPVTSLADAARSFGLRPALISARFPALCADVADAGRAWRAKLNDAQRRARDQRLTAYITARIRELRSDGVYPSVQKLYRLAKTQGLVSGKEAYRIGEIQRAALRNAPAPNHRAQPAHARHPRPTGHLGA